MLTHCRLIDSPRIAYGEGSGINTASGAWESNSLRFQKNQKQKPPELTMLVVRLDQLPPSTDNDEMRAAEKHLKIHRREHSL